MRIVSMQGCRPAALTYLAGQPDTRPRTPPTEIDGACCLSASALWAGAESNARR